MAEKEEAPLTPGEPVKKEEPPKEQPAAGGGKESPKAEDETPTFPEPKPKTEQELNEDPKETLNPDIIKEMEADPEVTEANRKAHELDRAQKDFKEGLSHQKKD